MRYLNGLREYELEAARGQLWSGEVDVKEYGRAKYNNSKKTKEWEEGWYERWAVREERIYQKEIARITAAKAS